MAFAGVLLQSVENHDGGYRLLDRYLPHVVLDPEASDFSYQINRPRLSSAPVNGLRINRLMKWSVARVQRMSISPGTERATVAPLGPMQFACRLEFDVNTASDNERTLPASSIPAILDELIGLAQEIASQGDVR
ncbi:MAG: hypothetical protein L0027_00725 [Candidatus Rokubacteria bacterium]|nr:hypothetical protein [Candidatus Rokubacteria bacterium]